MSIDDDLASQPRKSIHFAAKVACPWCGVPRGQACETRGSGITTEVRYPRLPHRARIRVANYQEYEANRAYSRALHGED